MEKEPLICGSNHIQCFKNLATFLGNRYFGILNHIVVDNEFAEKYHWAYKIQMTPKENRFETSHYIVVGRNAIGVGSYILDYKKVA